MKCPSVGYRCFLASCSPYDTFFFFKKKIKKRLNAAGKVQKRLRRSAMPKSLQ